MGKLVKPTNTKTEKWADKQPVILKAIRNHDEERLDKLCDWHSDRSGIAAAVGTACLFTFILGLATAIRVGLGYRDDSDLTTILSFLGFSFTIGVPLLVFSLKSFSRYRYLLNHLKLIKSDTYKVIREVTPEGLEIKLIRRADWFEQIIESRLFDQDIESDLIEAASYWAFLKEKRKDLIYDLSHNSPSKLDPDKQLRAQELDRLLPT